MSLIISLILLIIFLAIGFYALARSSLTAPQGIIYLIVAVIFLLAGLVVGLGMAGINLGISLFLALR